MRGAAHLSPEDKERPAHDDEGRHQHLKDEAAGDDAVLHVTGRLPDHVPVNRLHPQAENNTATAHGFDTFKPGSKKTSRTLKVAQVKK